MSSITLFILFVCIIAILFLVLNLLFAPHNPYAEKFSSFECGFHSFLGQNRSQFNVKFFVFGLLFLLFDLEITLIFPFAVSQSLNSLYGLIIVLIFMIVITVGFVYELGKGALKIDTKENRGILSDNHSKTSISLLDKSPSRAKDSSNYRYSRGDGLINIRRLHTHPISKHHGANFKRLYSSSTKAGQGNLDFWKQVNSSKLDENNPFFLVNRFLKDFPNKILSINNLTCSFINTILRSTFKGFELSHSDFDLLMKTVAIKIELPADSKRLAEVVGKSVRGAEIGKAGVYKFTNIVNGFCYIGSSISLANRLATGYLGPKLGNRVIDLAIKDAGLEKFYLEVYLIPQEIEERILRDFTTEADRKQIFKFLSLALEQILLLTFNPEYNVLKVAGSPAGLKRTKESMVSNILKSSKSTYLYDIKNKELIYISETRGALYKLTPTGSNIGKYLLGKNRFYLDQFFISDHLLSDDTYSTNLKSEGDLFTYLNELTLNWRKNQISKNIDSTRKITYSKQFRPIELTNLETGAVKVFASVSETAKYVRSLNPDYKASPGSIWDVAKSGRVYKNLFKAKFVD